MGLFVVTAKIEKGLKLPLPPSVQRALKVKKVGESIAFVIRNGKVAVVTSRKKLMNLFTKSEWRKIEKLATEQPIAVFAKPTDAIRFHELLVRSK